MNFAQELDQKINEAVAANDLDTLHALLKDHFQESESTVRPYDAALELKPEYRDKLQASDFEANALVNWANRIERAARLVAYNLRTSIGFKGTRIVSEGDSWFLYPIILRDLIDNFTDEKDLAIFSLGAAGDLVEHMAVRREYHRALQKTRSPVLLLSGGGNDLLGEGRLSEILLNYQQGMSASDLINRPALENASNSILGFYRQILTDVLINHPGVTVFGHGYDTPFPKENGKYFGRPFGKAGVPLSMGRDVIEIIVDYFAGELSDLTNQFANYRFINLKGTVGNHANSWRDELHPEDAGFKRASTPMIEAVKDHIASLGTHSVESAPLSPFDVLDDETLSGFESAKTSETTIVLDPGHGGTTNLPGASWNNAIGPSGSLEKKWTLDVCLRARDELVSRGFNVLMTRDSDVSISGEGRRKVARDAKADCFVSVHFNASTGHNAQGTETYVHSNATSPRSVQLMRSVQSAMVAALGHRDRNASRTPDGILRGNFSVVRENRHFSKTAVCLNEISFMDRIDEENQIKLQSYRDRIAQALADGIEAYLEGGFESAQSFESADEQDFEDAIEENAARLGLSVPQYLGLAEAPGQAAMMSAHVDGSTLPLGAASFESHSGPSILDAMFTDAVAPTGSAQSDHGEGAFINASQGVDFSSLGQNPVADQILFNQAYAGFESSGFDYGGFADFVAGLGLRYFSPAELLYMGASNSSGGCKGTNAPPPRALWKNIANTARMLDEIRHRIGHPVRILSGFRNHSYNSCIGGATGSLHSRFNALDWTASGGSVNLWHQTARDVRAENLNDFKGGIGRYDAQNFIHIDTRGHEANW